VLTLAIAAAATLRAGAQQPTARALTEPWPEIVKVDGIEILHVQKSVYMLAGGGANVTVQIGVTFVDAGAPGQGEKIVAAVRHLTKKPLRYLVNTSADADNAGGNGAVVKAAGGTSGVGGNGGGAAANTGILVISHENALNRMMKGTPAFPALTGDALPDSSFFTPKKDFYANGEAVQILYQPKAHTDGDVLVFFRGSDVISTGDIFRTDSYPMIDVAKGGTLQGELDALNAILDITVPERNQMGGTRVIPGHGRICNEADVLEYRDMLTIIRDRVRDMVKKDMTLEQVKAAKPTLEYDGIYGTRKEWTGAMLLEAAYREIVAASTTPSGGRNAPGKK
jgi:glyoxylase-like metal-dependent hydrolase (beta-lactamase superfamily II)